MPACLVKFHALFTATIEVNASYFPHFAAFNLTKFISKIAIFSCILKSSLLNQAQQQMQFPYCKQRVFFFFKLAEYGIAYITIALGLNIIFKLNSGPDAICISKSNPRSGYEVKLLNPLRSRELISRMHSPEIE